jgi:ribosomal protein S18 acetylase RimI-like enzyme/predicted nucleic acid-binding protein
MGNRQLIGMSGASTKAGQKVSFKEESDRTALLGLLPQIVALADSEKEALGFWPDAALREAISRGSLIALTTVVEGNASLAGYIHYSGIFPHAKIQQIATVPECRRNGAASTLVRMLVSRLESQGYLTLKADIADNLTGSLAFYRGNGFVEVAKRQGGSARKRAILIHVRELETDSLFSFADRQSSAQPELSIRRRGAGEDPIYAFDLNVYFDLAKDRAKSDQARQLFASGLAHDIRLVVSSEFAAELRRTSKDQANDPILQLALKLPRLPKADAQELNEWAERIHDLVFVGQHSSGANTAQARSDAKHLAHAALSGAAAFITRDVALLDARPELLDRLGIDVISLDDIVALLPAEHEQESLGQRTGAGFQLATITANEVQAYLTSVGVSAALCAQYAGTQKLDVHQVLRAIKSKDEVLAVGALLVPRGMMPQGQLLVHARADQPDARLFADVLLDELTREACVDHPIGLELVHLAGQAAVNSISQARGFQRTKSGSGYSKVALGKPVTSDNWAAIAAEVRRKTGLALPNALPIAADRNELVSFAINGGEIHQMSGAQLENILSPSVFVWPGQAGVVVPIGQKFANDLLGTNPQRLFEFVENKDAAFLSRRGYVSSPRNAAIMPLDAPILFYESKRTGGRGAIIAVARIVDRVVVAKSDLPKDGHRRLVVDDVGQFSASDDVLFTTFDNVFPLPVPVPLSYLKTIGAAGNANLISAVSLSSEQITKILTQGWLREAS